MLPVVASNCWTEHKVRSQCLQRNGKYSVFYYEYINQSINQSINHCWSKQASFDEAIAIYKS